MTQSITILGATGSIGRSTLDVVSRYPERFSVHAVAGGWIIRFSSSSRSSCSETMYLISSSETF